MLYNYKLDTKSIISTMKAKTSFLSCYLTFFQRKKHSLWASICLSICLCVWVCNYYSFLHSYISLEPESLPGWYQMMAQILPSITLLLSWHSWILSQLWNLNWELQICFISFNNSWFIQNFSVISIPEFVKGRKKINQSTMIYLREEMNQHTHLFIFSFKKMFPPIFCPSYFILQFIMAIEAQFPPID